MCQSLSDVILQEGDGPTVILTLAKKIMSELAEVISDYTGTDGLNWFSVSLCGLSMLRQASRSMKA